MDFFFSPPRDIPTRRGVFLPLIAAAASKLFHCPGEVCAMKREIEGNRFFFQPGLGLRRLLSHRSRLLSGSNGIVGRWDGIIVAVAER